MNTSAHGQCTGPRKVGTPERLTRRPGTDKKRVRTVRATVNCSAGVSSPSMSVHRMRSCANTAHKTSGRVGKELPRGHVLEARPFLEVPNGQLDAGMGAVEGVDVDDIALEVGHEGKVAPLGPQCRLAPDATRAPHDAARPL